MEKKLFFSRRTHNETANETARETSARHAGDHRQRAHDAESCMLDVYQTDGAIIIKALLAGVRPENIDVCVANTVLSIKGVRIEDETIKPENYYYRECYFGPFSRSIILPEHTDTNAIKAAFKNGVLTVHIPKTKKTHNTINAH